MCYTGQIVERFGTYPAEFWPKPCLYYSLLDWECLFSDIVYWMFAGVFCFGLFFCLFVCLFVLFYRYSQVHHLECQEILNLNLGILNSVGTVKTMGTVEVVLNTFCIMRWP